MSDTVTDELRDNDYLQARLSGLWNAYFFDVSSGFPICVQFGSRARRRVGSITARDGTCHITVNGVLRHAYAPDFVIDATLAHELAHYVHGFGSGLPRQYRHAHHGGVVHQELAARGLDALQARADAWHKAHWPGLYAACTGDLARRRNAAANRADLAWETRLNDPEARTLHELHGRFVSLGQRLCVVSGRTPPFGVEWLRASSRQHGLSYWYARDRTVRMHGLLADRRVPDPVLDFELAYWLCRLAGPRRAPALMVVLEAAGLRRTADDAIRWRRAAWTGFRTRHFPR